MSKVVLFTFVLVVVLSSDPSNAAEKAPVNNEQLAYEITVTAPGSKSQGWHGTLYDKNGQPMKVKSGEKWSTDIGILVSVKYKQKHIPYGMISENQLKRIENILMDESWSYKLYRTHTDSKCPSWRGELQRRNVVIKPDTGEQVQTPMGPFKWLKEPQNEPHGWVHVLWKVKADPKC